MKAFWRQPMLRATLLCVCVCVCVRARVHDTHTENLDPGSAHTDAERTRAIEPSAR